MKSAPRIPFDRETAPKAKTKKTAVSDIATTVLRDGWKITNPITFVIAKTKIEKKRMKKIRRELPGRSPGLFLNVAPVAS